MITTDIDFPAELPCFLRESYDIQGVNEILRTDMASGRARQRREFENTPVQVTASILLSQQEAQLFEAWYRYELKSYQWFNATLRTPAGIHPIVCRFMQRYSGPQLTANKWRYTFSLELYEQDILPAGWSEYARDFILLSNYIDVAINREWPES